MKRIVILLLALSDAIGQVPTASVSGTVLDMKTRSPVPGAWVIANGADVRLMVKSTKSGGAGEFQITGLAAGTYSLCVQAPGDQYLDPCQWGNPTTVTLAFGQVVSALQLKLTAASVLNIQVQDSQKALSQTTKDGRHPDLMVGVLGPKGLYYPAHSTGGPMSAANTAATTPTYTYRLAVPHDTGLNIYIASHDLKLGDAAGVALPGNASQQAFQHATGDPKPKDFAFTVLGLLP